VKIWDSFTGSHLPTLELDSSFIVQEIAFSQDDTWIYAGGYKWRSNSASSNDSQSQIAPAKCFNTVLVWHATSGEKISTYKHHRSAVKALAASESALTLEEGGWVVRVHGEECKRVVWIPAEIRGEAQTSFGTRLVIACKAGDLCVLDFSNVKLQ
jgi:WD40 repeat protein